MRLPSDVKLELTRRFSQSCSLWLIAPEDQQWPMKLNLGIPTEAIALKAPEKVRAFICAWKNWQGEGLVTWCKRVWPVLGTQDLPEKLILNSPFEIAAWANAADRWKIAQERYKMLVAQWPILQRPLVSYFEMLADYTEIDFLQLIRLLQWLIEHPDSKLYPRQLPIPGIDSKWLESRKKIICDLWMTFQGNQFVSITDCFTKMGLLSPPRLLRFRLLDPELRAQLGGVSDMTAPISEIAALKLPVNQVFIVENLQTGLALPDLSSTVAFMGLGYAVDIFASIPWLKKPLCYYWGDIDTHGFAILNRVRQYLPHAQSFLMDQDTLRACSELVGYEDKQHSANEFANLTIDERALYQLLKFPSESRFYGARLEQERIPWEYVEKALQARTFMSLSC